MLAQQRAKKSGLPFSITAKDIKIPKRCPALGIVLKQGTGHRRIDSSPTLDRINPSLGYVPGNVVVISGLANNIKSSADYRQIARVSSWLKRLTTRRRSTV
jgi:chitodextrinase